MNGIKQGTNSVNKAYLGTNLIMGGVGGVNDFINHSDPNSYKPFILVNNSSQEVKIEVKNTADTIIVTVPSKGSYVHTEDETQPLSFRNVSGRDIYGGLWYTYYDQDGVYYIDWDVDMYDGDEIVSLAEDQTNAIAFIYIYNY